MGYVGFEIVDFYAELFFDVCFERLSFTRCFLSGIAVFAPRASYSFLLLIVSLFDVA
jgi:hypothetical protein